MSARGWQLRGFDARSWHRLVTLVAPGFASHAPASREREARSEGGLLFVLYGEAGVVRALHSLRGAVELPMWAGPSSLEACAASLDTRWHFIGHLQTNKARFVAPIASVVHSVDTAKLAAELGRRAADAGRTVEALVQVNVSGELSKSGCEPAVLDAVLDAIEASSALRLRGLMTVPPASDDAEAAAPVFRALAALRDARGGVARLPELSMGMTHDLEVAVACGATMVRVGSALFGAR